MVVTPSVQTLSNLKQSRRTCSLAVTFSTCFLSYSIKPQPLVVDIGRYQSVPEQYQHFPSLAELKTPSFRVSVTLQLSSVEWEKFIHTATENLIYTGTSVNFSSLCIIAEAQPQRPFWGHDSVELRWTSSSSVLQNAFARYPQALQCPASASPSRDGVGLYCNTDRRRGHQWVNPVRLSSCLKLYCSAGGLLTNRLFHEVEAITRVIITFKSFGKANCARKCPRGAGTLKHQPAGPDCRRLGQKDCLGALFWTVMAACMPCLLQ